VVASIDAVIIPNFVKVGQILQKFKCMFFPYGSKSATDKGKAVPMRRMGECRY
jgi:hypothetical protein